MPRAGIQLDENNPGGRYAMARSRAVHHEKLKNMKASIDNTPPEAWLRFQKFKATSLAFRKNYTIPLSPEKKAAKAAAAAGQSPPEPAMSPVRQGRPQSCPPVSKNPSPKKQRPQSTASGRKRREKSPTPQRGYSAQPVHPMYASSSFERPRTAETSVTGLLDYDEEGVTTDDDEITAPKVVSAAAGRPPMNLSQQQSKIPPHDLARQKPKQSTTRNYHIHPQRVHRYGLDDKQQKAYQEFVNLVLAFEKGVMLEMVEDVLKDAHETMLMSTYFDTTGS
eukprot:GFYU01006527.1.p1 GENE.GFYU01006527.1~~GFYU01006527.1.p1  ORF type:complete len:279 (-),score=44.61 GFYU01006527.1:163-999(-)